MKIFFKKHRFNFNTKSGFMMLEVLVVAAIMVLSIFGAMTVAEKSIRVSRQALHATQAAFLLEEGAEAMRILRDDDWDNIYGLSIATDYYPIFSGSTWTLSQTPSDIGIFTRKITIADVNRDEGTGDISASGVDDGGTKLVTVTVSWPEGAQTITKTLPFYIMDIF